jgi:hypothetical protein
VFGEIRGLTSINTNISHGLKKCKVLTSINPKFLTVWKEKGFDLNKYPRSPLFAHERRFLAALFLSTEEAKK